MAKKWRGIDVSYSQGKINWSKAKQQISFAFIRMGYIGNSETLNVDSQYEKNVSECERLNIPYGIYVYSYATSVKAVQRAMPFVIKRLKNKHPTLPIYLDLEESRISQTGMSNVLAMAKTFAEEIEKNGYMYGTYANLNWFNTVLTNSWYQTKSIWIAQYYSKCTYSKKYEVWQYSSNGKIAGIEGNVDLNYMYKSPIIGDVDGDGNVTAKDAREVLRASAKLDNLTAHQKAQADVDKDGKITSADAREILKDSANLK